MTKKLPRTLSRSAVLMAFISLITINVSAQQPKTTVNLFEWTPKWHWTSGDAGIIEFTTAWKTQGSNSLVLHNNTANGSNYTAYDADLHHPQSPATIVMDVRNGSAVAYNLKLEVIHADWSSTLIELFPLEPHEITTLIFNNTENNIKRLRLVQDNYGSNLVTTHIDNIRFGTVLWDACEPVNNWAGAYDASFTTGTTDSSGVYSKTTKSPLLSSSSSIMMQWDSTVSTGTSAEISATGFLKDLSAYHHWQLDVYRPASTSENVQIKIWSYSGSLSQGHLTSEVITIPQANTWTTVKILMEDPAAHRVSISEITIVVQQTDIHTTGLLYFDNLIANSGIAAQSSPIIPPGIMHGLKDFNDARFFGNDFYGQQGYGVKDTTANIAITTGGYSGYAQKLVYDVNQEFSFAYWSSTLKMNSHKDKLVVFLKGGTDNPGAVKLTVKSGTPGPNSKDAWCFLTDITTSWQQYVINIGNGNRLINYDPSKPYDPATVSEIVIGIENAIADDKSGDLWIDEVAFYDLDDELTASPGLILPQASPTTPAGYRHDLKLFVADDPLIRNQFYGDESFSTSAEKINDNWIANAIVTPQVSASDHYTAPAVKIDYTVDDDYSFVYYSHKLQYNTSKDKLVLYLKGGADNPGIVKLELKYGAGSQAGSAYYYLGRISNTEWQQYIVPLKASEATAIPYDPGRPYDPASIYEVVVSLENVSVRNTAGSLYVDDISFFDQDDALNPYPGFKPVPKPGEVLAGPNMDNPTLWKKSKAAGSTLSLSSFPGLNNDGIIGDYNLNGGWVSMGAKVNFDPRVNPLVFYIKPSGEGQLEMKFKDTDGSVFSRLLSLSGYRDWMRPVVYLNDMNYTQGGDSTFGTLDSLQFRFHLAGRADLWFDQIGYAPSGTTSSFKPHWDPDSTMAGIGFQQRRAVTMTPEDTLVITYLEQLQDSSFHHNLVPSQLGDAAAHTFNNSLAAMAFILKEKKERAERILDFYANSVHPGNTDKDLQDFYYLNEKRGFYQSVNIKDYHTDQPSDRWMGDMCWLLLAYKFYERQYSSDKYETISNLLRDLLRSYYVQDPAGGYVKKGWIRGHHSNDSTISNDGHHEGSIDAYAALKLCDVGADTIQGIKSWIEDQLTTQRKNKDLPLDLYTWRAMAFGADDASAVKLMDIVEYDLRYRKKLYISNAADSVLGFYSGADIFADNFWLDGFGHAVCAYLSYGDRQRGYFYANQLDRMIITNVVSGITTNTLPYAANNSGDYSWVDPTKGFSSTAAWYIFAKNCFNPFSAFSIYLDVPYAARENNSYGGAASAKMILDYEGANTYTQTQLHSYATGSGVNYTPGLNYIDPYGMYRTLNAKELAPAFNYAPLTQVSQANAYKDLCFWLSYDIPNAPRIHMPATVSVGGTFADWLVVNGFQSSANPHLGTNYTVYGFYVKDPKVNGIGQDMYIQAGIFGSDYFLPISSSLPGLWSGKYVTVDEPPVNDNNITIQPPQPAAQLPVNNEKRFLAAEQGLKRYRLMNDRNISTAMNGATRGRIYFADLPPGEDDYYIVTFEKGNGVTASVTIDAASGSLKEATFMHVPDMDYYSKLEEGSMSRVAREMEQSMRNPFYPDPSALQMLYDPDEVTTGIINAETDASVFDLIPNPASHTVNVLYSVEKDGMVRLSLYDARGVLIENIVHTSQTAGTHTVNIDLGKVKPGIYLCRLISGRKVKVKRLVRY